MHTPHISSGGRYPVLRTVAILWLVGAVLAFGYGVYQAVVTLTGNVGLQTVQMGGASLGSRLIGFFVWLALTFFAVVTNIAIAELIKLAMDVEHNTRATALNTAAAAEAVAGANPVPRMGNGRSGIMAMEESAEGALIRGH